MVEDDHLSGRRHAHRDATPCLRSGSPDGNRHEAQEVTRVTRIYNFLFSLRREEGQTMAEYGVVLAVITVLLVASFTALSGEIKAAIDAVAKVLPA